MTTDFSNPKEAAKLFLSWLVADAYDGAIEDVTSNLEMGPPGRKPSHELVILHQWFQDLDNESRKHVLAVIRHACDAALFHCLVLLDGLAGYPVEGKVTDFAVYLQAYEGQDTRKANSPQFSVRLNPANTTEYLHDMFHWMLQERAKGEE